MALTDLIQEVQDAAAREASGDPAAHMQLLDSLQRLQNAAWTPMEKMTRLRNQLYHNACVRLGQKYGILQSLSTSKEATAMELSQATKVDELLIIRLMRILTGIGFAEEISPSRYRANETTDVSIRRGYLADVKYTTDIAMKVCSNVAQTIESNIDTHTFTMGKPHFTWLSEDPEYGPGFDEFMTERRNAVWEKWFRIYPMADKIRELDTKKDVLLIDIGGGLGFWTKELQRELGNDVPGRLIVQDQPHVIQQQDGIETMAYNFFTPQPIKGAQFYFFKQVIHNWSDIEALQILKNTADAMDDTSICLINDHVLPEEKVSLRISYWDMGMLVLMSGIERTESQWVKLVEAAGLRIVRIWYETNVTGEVTEAVMECRKIKLA